MIKLCTYELYTSISVLKFISDPVHTLHSGCMHGCSHGGNAVNKFGFFLCKGGKWCFTSENRWQILLTGISLRH